MGREPNKPASETRVSLDGDALRLPPGADALTDVRAFIESVALNKRRVLCSLKLNGAAIAGSESISLSPGDHIEARSVPINQLYSRLTIVAQEEINRLIERVEAVALLIVINSAAVGRELWWDLAPQLRQPILTLNLLPEGASKPGASERLLQASEQLTNLVRRVDLLSELGDCLAFSDGLEKALIPWLEDLRRVTTELYDSGLS